MVTEGSLWDDYGFKLGSTWKYRWDDLKIRQVIGQGRVRSSNHVHGREMAPPWLFSAQITFEVAISFAGNNAGQWSGLPSQVQAHTPMFSVLLCKTAESVAAFVRRF